MTTALLHRGFRPFFFLAGTFSVISTVMWTLVYSGKWPSPASTISSFHWHAHEMIYGFSMAVIAGFILTAAQNWTGIATLNGPRLGALALLWVAARACFSMDMLPAACVLDTLFIGYLCYDTTSAVVKAGNRKQMVVLTKLYTLAIFNTLFYLGALGFLDQGLRLGIYGGFYLVIGLIQMMGRRLVPFFVERASKGETTLQNYAYLDRALLLLFVLFYIVELIGIYPRVTAALALVYFFTNSYRLMLWNCAIIWKKPLLWVLYIALWSISLGFLLLALGTVFPVTKFVALHAMSYGGIGLATMGMMARVTRGHTGRDIYTSSRIEPAAFLILATGTISRVVMPIFLPANHILWISLSQALWVIAFTLFVISSAPMLFSPRIDGKPG